MPACVVDTNVILVANAAHEDVSPECVIACVEHLMRLMASGVLVIDDEFRILSQYLNKTSPRAAKGVGDIFVQWALRHRTQSHRVQQVSLTENPPNHFVEFPDQALQLTFDTDDRMFAAVSHAYSGHAPVWQASDCKWLDWWQPLQTAGIEVAFLCQSDICRFYARKFPGKPVPELP